MHLLGVFLSADFCIWNWISDIFSVQKCGFQTMHLRLDLKVNLMTRTSRILCLKVDVYISTVHQHSCNHISVHSVPLYNSLFQCCGSNRALLEENSKTLRMLVEKIDRLERRQPPSQDEITAGNSIADPNEYVLILSSITCPYVSTLEYKVTGCLTEIWCLLTGIIFYKSESQ